MKAIQSICVYCGSSPGNGDSYMQAGRDLGRAISSSGINLIYGGGIRGVMGAVASGAREAGGKVTGIIPRFLMDKEATQSALRDLDELIITDNMHQRKHLMFEKSDAFVALPGGLGTVEEIVEIMTWAQLGHHLKPMVFCNIGGFWNPMLTLLDHMAREGFIHTAHRVKPIVADSGEEAVRSILDAAAGLRANDGKAAIIEQM
ncbi:TIGR00730 family Rossman fold protein [Mesorhizobium sp. NBSH29]|uniref:LOG family protein n=1 Tax=Mesorhizobium sp. NBSH29 TaxID=2654249 RepID=UPI001896699D|nr:TIGR00730 family Rossman fold protein [Mesorhizobium sp. NBSH29]QPC87290.1 TIGR00730 family Rossman fold protein [Mesorhizobium sp. NBSH29]